MFYQFPKKISNLIRGLCLCLLYRDVDSLIFAKISSDDVCCNQEVLAVYNVCLVSAAVRALVCAMVVDAGWNNQKFDSRVTVFLHILRSVGDMAFFVPDRD